MTAFDHVYFNLFMDRDEEFHLFTIQYFPFLTTASWHFIVEENLILEAYQGNDIPA